MGKHDLKDLVIRSLTEEITDGERTLIEKEVLQDYSFKSDFRDRVIDRIEDKSLFSNVESDFFRSFNSLFTKVALTGMIAILLLIVSLAVSQGSLSYDTLLGMDATIDEGLISLLVE